MKVSLITTVFNEEKAIDIFLKSILSQSKMPDEVIIVDGKSTDDTFKKIKGYEKVFKKVKINLKLISKKGNRSIGRNEAVNNASNEIIVCSDSGCILDKDWIKNIIKPFLNLKVDVVAGYYNGQSQTIFQKCLVPYVLVMEDKINRREFLPASRSMAFKKSIWEKVGGFNEKYSHNEDYVFAQKLKKFGARIVFIREAIVSWIPRKTLTDAFRMFFRFALGDSESGIIRDKVILIFARYLLSFYLLFLAFIEKSLFLSYGVALSIAVYVLWSINKNYKYVKDKKAFIFLPILQFTSDLAVLIGTCIGLIKSVFLINYEAVFRKNLAFIILLVVYIATMLFVISSGIPSQSHPFPYHMDEWHQLQAVRNVFTYGSPNLAGSANGTMFHFFVSGLLLTPFYITKIINPFIIKSSVDSLLDQEKLFILLRLNTLFFGVLTLVTTLKIARILKLNAPLVVFLLIFTPVWLVLSNFFKYDIALTFWIALSLYYFLKYAYFPKLRNFIFACFFSGVAFSVKVSGLPLLPIIFLAYFIFTPSFSKKYFYLFLGVIVFILTSVLLGLPDIVFGGKNMNAYLYENITGSAKIIGNYNLGESLLNFTLLHKLPAIFGHGLYLVSVLSLLFVAILACANFINKKYQDFKIKIFVLLSFFIFCLSLVPLGITISTNRVVVLLPFMVIINAVVFKNLIHYSKTKNILRAIFLIFIVIIMCIQILESYLWVKLKINPSPQQVASEWIVRNISKNSDIGLENIPIYQFEPDFILKEFYNKQYDANFKTQYNYFIVNKNTKTFPSYVVISNVRYEKQYLKTSLKNGLVSKLLVDGYKKIAYFPLTAPLYEYFDSDFYYPYIGLFAYPDDISIFEKKK